MPAPAADCARRFRSLVAAGFLIAGGGFLLGADAVHDVPTTIGSGISIRLSTPLQFAPHFGFIPIRVQVENHSAQAGSWRLNVTSGDASVRPGQVQAGFDVSAPAGATQEQWIFAPLAAPGVVATPVIDETGTPPPTSLPPGRYVASAPGATIAVGVGRTDDELEAAATAAIEPTRLLDIPWGVRESVVTHDGVVTFEQTGSAWALGKPPAGSLPPGVLVNLHPAVAPGEVIRTITYVDPADLAALDATPASRVDAYQKAVIRNTVALWRYGYLRGSNGVETSAPTKFGDRDGVVTVTVSETGPASLLNQPEPEALPPNTLVTILPGPVPPGGVTRKFTVTTFVPEVADNPTTARPFSAVLGAAEPGLIRVEVSGSGLEQPIWTDLSSGLDGEIQPMPPIAVPTELENIIRERLALGNLRSPPTVTAIDPETLPADWRVWSSMHAVLLLKTQYETLKPEYRTALRHWAAMGGRLVLATNSNELGETERVGAGVITTLGGPLAYMAPSEASRQLQLASPVVGLPSRMELSRDNASVASFGAGERSDTGWLNYVLVGFAIVAGPVNLLFFAPSGKRHRMLVTMPLIALAGAAVMGVGIVLRVGLGGEGVRETVVALLPEGGGAAVFQDQVSRTGLLASHRFELSGDTILAAVPLDAGGAEPGNMFLTRDAGGAGGDWFRSREYQAYHLRRFEEVSGRVAFSGSGEGGAPTVTSSLPGTLNDFAWIDGSDRIWTAPSVAPGQKVTLVPADGNDWPRLRPMGSSGLVNIFLVAADREPGRWTARAESGFSPISTLNSVRWQDSDVLITGFAPPTAPARSTLQASR